MTADLGTCGVNACTADAVAFISRTIGQSARLTVITGPRALALADGTVTADATATVCHEHAAAALDDLLRAGNRPDNLLHLDYPRERQP